MHFTSFLPHPMKSHQNTCSDYDSAPALPQYMYFTIGQKLNIVFESLKYDNLFLYVMVLQSTILGVIVAVIRCHNGGN